MCVGLIGIGGALFLTQTRRAQEEAALGPTAPPPPTPVPTNTPLPPPPTHTPTSLPTPTSTQVVGNNAQVPSETVGEETVEELLPVATSTLMAGEVTPTNTLVVPRGTATPAPADTVASAPPPAQMPAGGGILPLDRNYPLLWAGIGLLVLLVVGIIARFRSGSPIR